MRINALLALNSLLLNPQFNEKMLDKFKSISDLLLRESDTAVKLNAFSTFSILLSNKNCNPPLMLCFEQIATNLLKFKDDSIRVMAFSHIMPLLGNTSLECEMLEKLNDVVSRIREYETEKASAYKFFEVLGSLLRNRGFEASMLDDFGSIVISLKTGEDSGAKKPLFTAFLTLLDNKAFDANLMSGLVRLTQKLCPFAGGSISNAVFSALNGFCENPRLDSKNVEQIERIFDKIMNEITPDSYHHELRKDIHLDIFTSMEGLLKGGPEKGMLDSFERVLDSVFDMPAREVVSCFDLISEMVRHNKLETSMFELLERIITDKLYTKYYDHDPEIEIRENVFQQLGVLVRHKNFEVGMLFDFEKMVRVFSNEPNAQGNVFDAVGALLRNYSLDRMMLASIADTLTIPQLKQLEMEERLNLAYGVSVLREKKRPAT